MTKNKAEEKKRLTSKTPKSEKVVKQLKLTKKENVKLRDEIEELSEKIKTLNERVLLSQADLENYKKRQKREYLKVYRNIQKEAYRPFLKLLDDLHRTIQIKIASENSALFEGVELVISNYEKTLKNFGITPLESLGENFNHDLHEAVMMKEKKSAKSNTIIEVFERGYMIGEEVLRHAKVVVAK